MVRWRAWILLSNFSLLATATRQPTKLRNHARQREANIWNDAMMGRIGASIVGESALIDKETGRILWEGGASSISNSITPFLSELGIQHIKAIILSTFLLAVVFSAVAKELGQKMGQVGIAPNYGRVANFVLASTRWMLDNAVPQFNRSITLVILGLYLLEAYTCNTRRYLTNAITSPNGVEEYIERLRQEEPVVSWRVRCFHYEPRLLACVLFPQFWRRLVTHRPEAGWSRVSSPSLLTRKVITRQAECTYQYKR